MKRKYIEMKNVIILISSLLLTGCLGYPEGIKPVTDFKLSNYLGKWYEIARLDHSFERGLQNVTAEYSLREDGGIKVLNRGFSSEKKKWKEATGRAYFVEGNDIGYFKVSFWRPFYGSYVIFELDKNNYQHAFVTSSNKSFLWLLSRTPTVKKDLIDSFIRKSKKLGFETENLIFVKQN